MRMENRLGYVADGPDRRVFIDLPWVQPNYVIRDGANGFASFSDLNHAMIVLVDTSGLDN
jgi:hypothetical protein